MCIGVKLTRGGLAMVNLMLTKLRNAQIAEKILFLNISVRLFLEDVSFELVNPVKQMALFIVVRHRPIH